MIRFSTSGQNETSINKIIALSFPSELVASADFHDNMEMFMKIEKLLKGLRESNYVKNTDISGTISGEVTTLGDRNITFSLEKNVDGQHLQDTLPQIERILIGKSKLILRFRDPLIKEQLDTIHDFSQSKLNTPIFFQAPPPKKSSAKEHRQNF